MKIRKNARPTESYFYLFPLLALLFFLSTTAVYGQRNESKKPSKQEVFFRNVEQLKPGMSQAEVKEIMGDPYKLSFELKDNDELEESIFYQNEIWLGKWTLIVYRCVFINNSLVELQQNEYLHTKDHPMKL